MHTYTCDLMLETGQVLTHSDPTGFNEHGRRGNRRAGRLRARAEASSDTYDHERTRWEDQFVTQYGPYWPSLTQNARSWKHDGQQLLKLHGP